MKALSGLKISHRIITLMLGIVVGFVMMGVAYYVQIASELSIQDLERQRQSGVAELNQLESNVQDQQAAVERWLQEGSRQALSRYDDLHEESISLLDAVSAGDPRYVNANLLSELQSQNNAFHQQVALSREQAGLRDIGTRPETPDMTLAPAALVGEYRQWFDNNVGQRLAQARQAKNLARTLFAALLLITAIGTTVGMYFLYRGIVLPLWHIQGVIIRQNRGEAKARVQLKSQDELGTLGRAFNRLLDERIQVLEDQARENDQLNTSIIALIKSLGTIANKKDLTIKVPVSEDVTGTVSDAVNLFTSETARTMHQVTEISEQVNRISDQLLNQSGNVSRATEEERAQVAEANRALETLAKAMNQVAMEARTTNQVAHTAIDNTHKAQTSVSETVLGIQAVRSTIAETEKRIKRLGDRSQEITGIVNLINTIAERTHILALNASMHAASAGEAGKGFAVVAEEVQRLAENARGATSDISAMVNNIRVETSDTVNIMNKLITQVADGTRLAEDSGKRMQDTEAATRQLVDHVKAIARNSVAQASNASRVRDRATSIAESTETTRHELEQQQQQIDELKSCARTLVERVSVFHLPEIQAGAWKAGNILPEPEVNQDLAPSAPEHV